MTISDDERRDQRDAAEHRAAGLPAQHADEERLHEREDDREDDDRDDEAASRRA